MRSVRPANPRFAELEPYDPKTLPAEVLLSANENTRNLPEAVRDEVAKRLAALDYNRYPDPLANRLRDLLAAENGLARENILVGNGGDELLFNLMLAWGGTGRVLLNCPPTFSIYQLYAEIVDTTVVNIPRKEGFALDQDAILSRVAEGDVDFVIITSPNNPTGDLAPRDFVERLLEATDALVLIDEAYFEFGGQTVADLLPEHKNLMVLRTFSKAYSLAAARVGYIMADPEVIAEFMKVRQPYSVNALSQVVAEVVCEMRSEFDASITQIVSERERLMAELPTIAGVEVWPSSANYILARMPNAHEVWVRLREEHSVLVRDFSHSAGLEGCLRLSVGQPEENDRLLAALRALVEE